MVSTIFKARGELLNLNYMPHRLDLPIICSLCNSREREDIVHFIGKCAILSEIRNVYFNKTRLEFNEVIELLNGSNWLKLYRYIKEASNYRNYILNDLYEF